MNAETSSKKHRTTALTSEPFYLHSITHDTGRTCAWSSGGTGSKRPGIKNKYMGEASLACHCGTRAPCGYTTHNLTADGRAEMSNIQTKPGSLTLRLVRLAIVGPCSKHMRSSSDLWGSERCSSRHALAVGRRQCRRTNVQAIQNGIAVQEENMGAACTVPVMLESVCYRRCLCSALPKAVTIARLGEKRSVFTTTGLTRSVH